MPIIPLPQNLAPLGPVPGPVLDRVQRPTVNNSGQINALGAYAKAAQMPIDQTDVAAPYRADGAVGEAVIRLGGVVAAANEKRLKAREDFAILEHSKAMSDADSELQNYMAKNPQDTASWTSYAKQLAQGIRDKALADTRLTDGGKQRFAVQVGSWATKLERDTDTLGKKQDYGLARSAYVNGIGDRRALGRIDEADSMIKEADSKGYLFPGEADHFRTLNTLAQGDQEMKVLGLESKRLLMTGNYDDAVKLWTDAKKPDAVPDAVWNEQRDLTIQAVAKQKDSDALDKLESEDPAQGLKELEVPSNFTGLSPTEIAQRRVQMAKTREFMADQEVEEAKRAIALLPPDKLKDATPDKLGVEFKQATPFHRALAAEFLKLKQGKAALDSEGNYLDDLKEATAYNPANDPQGIAAVRLRTRWGIRYTPGGPMADKLEAALKQREKGDPSQVQIGPAVTALKDWADTGKFGNYKVPIMVDGVQVTEPGKKLGTATKPGWLWGTNTVDVYQDLNGKPTTTEKPSVPVLQDDPMLKAKVDAKVKAIVDQIEAEVKAGRFKTDDDVLERARSLAEKAGVKLPQVKPGPSLPPPVPPPGYKPTLFPTNPPTTDGLDTLLKRYGK